MTVDTMLSTTLANVIQQLANFFGTTTEIVMENAPAWITKYAWYSFMCEVPWCIFAGIFLSALVDFGFAGIFFGISGYDYEDKKTRRVFWAITTILTIITFACCLGIEFGKCYIAPEFYGLEAIMDVIKGA